MSNVFDMLLRYLGEFTRAMEKYGRNNISREDIMKLLSEIEKLVSNNIEQFDAIFSEFSMVEFDKDTLDFK